MKKRALLLNLFLLFVVFGYAQDLAKKLDKLMKKYDFTYEVVHVDSFFTEKYVLQFEQAVDHSKPDGPRFQQRVFLSHLDEDAPVLFITEGYSAAYAANPKYVNELAPILNANQVCAEHRYFGTSVPEPVDWNFLTVQNAAADHHHIIEVLKNIYDKKWVSTGISKGGQTTIYHRYFYPEDVDISVPYVAPLNFSIEEQRVYMFLDSVGSEECRERIFDFQVELMKNKKKYLPAFENLAEKENLTYRMGLEKAYDLTVFEYPFAFWQWGSFSCEEIPDSFDNPQEIIGHLDAVAGIDWISNQGIEVMFPFFYQALREIGFYGYDITPFKEWTSYKQNPVFTFTLPEGMTVVYEPDIMRQVDYFVRHEAKNMFFIYGEYDPWSAPAVELTYHTNSIKVVKPAGSHRTRINNLPDSQQEIVVKQLGEWMND
jgi:hypothetical protein